MNEVKEDYNLVTETYDEWDRLLYVNYFRSDVPYRGATGGDRGLGVLSIPSEDRRPKKLLYQDVYTYKEGTRRVAPAVRRVYQPEIDFSASRDGSTITLTGHFICRSKVLASGFIWNTASADRTMLEALASPNYFNGVATVPDELRANNANQIYRGSNALGTKTHTINSNDTHFIKAFVQIETGTLFSKTITI